MQLIKNIKAGKASFFKILLFIILIIFNTSSKSFSDNLSLDRKFVEIKILDKVSSKNDLLKIAIGEEKKFKNLLIKFLKCKNSKFDDNPEVTAYMQIKDLANKNNNEVFIFNGWTFSSSPTINSFDHPVYDIWLTKCY